MDLFLSQRVCIKFTKFNNASPGIKSNIDTLLYVKMCDKILLADIRTAMSVSISGYCFITFLTDTLLNRLFSNSFKFTGLYLPPQKLITHISITGRQEKVWTEKCFLRC